MAKKRSKHKAPKAELRSAAPSPALMRLCRLCEAKDGPFLNIFDIEQAIAKKIENLLPFMVNECDDLPHKICFRCSAKVEELHDFVQRCVKTQENLMTQLGKVVTPKTNSKRKLWEERLLQSNITNDDVCDAVVEEAMAGMTDADLQPLPLEEILPKNRKRESDKSDTNMESATFNKKFKIQGDTTPVSVQSSDSEYSLKDKTLNPVPVLKEDKRRSSRSDAMKKLAIKELPAATEESPKRPKSDVENSENEKSIPVPKLIKKTKEPEKNVEPPADPQPPQPPFNIMDHVSTLKIHGVGVLFQCGLCNRNFLNKDVVESHGCAKTGAPKRDFSQNLRTPIEPPRNPMAHVKYINNQPPKPEEPKPEPPKPVAVPLKVEKPEPPVKPKPRAGPASKTKRNIPTADIPSVGMRVTPREPTPPPSPPMTPAALEVPAIPGLKNRYRLLPGPNNTFTLVEDPDPSQPKKSNDNKPTAVQPVPIAPKPASLQPVPKPASVQPAPITPKPSPVQPVAIAPKPGPLRMKAYKNKNIQKKIPVSVNNDVIDLDDEKDTPDMPYPVGLFQAMTAIAPPPPSPIINPPAPKPPTVIPAAPKAPVTFTTPAVKKQSYTVVQTGNPSKLLISTKPQPTPVEPPKPKSKRKSKHAVLPAPNKEAFNVTIEDTAPEKDNFFTFVNVDPLLQPSYVLPTNNIIQESQISTSSAKAGGSKPKEGYKCSLCPEIFSREKKLLVHLQAHYDKLDQESRSLTESSKKRSRR